ncbi:MAG: carboxypeptidase regulatory-like domain-containing protein [Patescibacteria group bacterium]|nr:carboxypeptidase regulatory-like domain-containing protein [Patescibacteria group bacterium]MDD5715839.1 carboxypeptidase regulatory-like domain-containing protein [Patescibacteria group bacterium]
MARRFSIALWIVACCVLFPAAAHAATLYLAPSSASPTVGGSFNVSVGVNTAGVAINSAQATVTYPNDILEVTAISQAGVFSLWPVTPSYSNASGTITFAGGVPNPGYTGSGGGIITITFHALVAGTANVTIGSASVLANDGLGTNVLTGSAGGTYTVSEPGEPPPPPPPPPEEEKHLPVAPTITSPTHPEQALWYAVADSTFEWTQQSGVTGFSYAFDDQASTTPDTIRDTTGRSSSYTETGDGTWYFHVRAENEDGWGPAGHYKVQIDRTPPLEFSIDLLDGKRTQNKTPRISFETTDATSGIHHYGISVDGLAVVLVDVGATTPYTLPELADGKHTVRALAYDFAGNSTSASESFTIGAPTTPVPPDGQPGDDGSTPQTNDDTAPPAAKILDKIEEALPKPIRAITDAIGNTIGDIRNNPTVTSILNQIVEPSVTTAAIIVATGVTATTITSFQLINIIYLFFRFSYLWLAPVAFGKRKRSWGSVFDSTTGRPIRRAIVRIFSREFNKLRESQITDAQGRFGFLVEPGEYYVTVVRPGYIFPSHILKTAAISQYENIYRGDTFTVSEKDAGTLNINIPIDPDTEAVPESRLRWLRILNRIGFILERVSTPLLITGTVLSWLALVLDPVIANYAILSLYTALIFIKYLIGGILERSWGVTQDAETGEPISMAVVRIYNAEKSTLLGTRVTNSRGQFTALVAPGSYYLVAVKNGYETFKSRPITVGRRQGLIRLKVELKPKEAAAAPTLPGKGTVITLEAVDEGVSGGASEIRGKGQEPAAAEAALPEKGRMPKKRETGRQDRRRSVPKQTRKGAVPEQKPAQPAAGGHDLGDLSSQDS